ncbi:hypothetical protein B0H67DRAFT_340200 [Lasiosphaeris hirsuta]|uniref:Uncharacterized protein n=1 Tax=Lasiosphaeris hirsuta TaxID=260670 RepID=A0AA40DQJ9_9PEZI|nr:hypothetical protein B0H67DRAFT_340200 [Lasiosphaeris hirsuta]
MGCFGRQRGWPTVPVCAAQNGWSETASMAMTCSVVSMLPTADRQRFVRSCSEGSRRRGACFGSSHSRPIASSFSSSPRRVKNLVTAGCRRVTCAAIALSGREGVISQIQRTAAPLAADATVLRMGRGVDVHATAGLRATVAIQPKPSTEKRRCAPALSTLLKSGRNAKDLVPILSLIAKPGPRHISTHRQLGSLFSGALDRSKLFACPGAWQPCPGQSFSSSGWSGTSQSPQATRSSILEAPTG